MTRTCSCIDYESGGGFGFSKDRFTDDKTWSQAGLSFATSFAASAATVGMKQGLGIKSNLLATTATTSINTVSSNFTVGGDGSWNWGGWGNIDTQKAVISGVGSYVSSTATGNMRDPYMNAFAGSVINAYTTALTANMFERFGGRDFGGQYSLDRPVSVDTLSISVNQAYGDARSRIMSDGSHEAATPVDNRSFWQKIGDGFAGAGESLLSIEKSFSDEVGDIVSDAKKIGSGVVDLAQITGNLILGRGFNTNQELRNKYNWANAPTLFANNSKELDAMAFRQVEAKENTLRELRDKGLCDNNGKFIERSFLSELFESAVNLFKYGSFATNENPAMRGIIQRESDLEESRRKWESGEMRRVIDINTSTKLWQSLEMDRQILERINNNPKDVNNTVYNLYHPVIVSDYSLSLQIFQGYPKYNGGGDHSGIDIGGTWLSNIKSPGNGNVRATHQGNEGEYGNSSYIEIGIEDGTIHKFKHTYNAFNLKTGDEVTRGQNIGKLDKTGSWGGWHLHYEVKDSQGNPVNPLEYLIETQPLLDIKLNSSNTEKVFKRDNPDLYKQYQYWKNVRSKLNEIQNEIKKK